MLRYFTVILLLAIAPIGFCKGGISADTIDSIAFHTGGFFMYADGWGNPNGCTRSTAIVLQDSDVNYDKAYAMLLAAYMSGKKVSGYSDYCVEFDGQTYNMIRGFKYLTVR
ncbi:hypothetical protein [Reinekea sp. G2M2-21]|uniref:hypothetical protein n=1 Tax=Reinekea sp. G2M2-21 TaxID=2788942 RepID=UPI0018A9E102|nr:hypothetical protein [Reinekea sp. G2M2-21]